ncbi:unnamed protein product, partial [Rotaria sp. Silwood2]
MPSTNSFIKCKCSSELKLINSYQCSHCLTWFCYQCLIKHHHNDIKSEFMDMIDRIDKILVQFLYHAHSQTAWTNHFTEDPNRLKIYIKYIEANCVDVYPKMKIITCSSEDSSPVSRGDDIKGIFVQSKREGGAS